MKKRKKKRLPYRDLKGRYAKKLRKKRNRRPRKLPHPKRRKGYQKRRLRHHVPSRRVAKKKRPRNMAYLVFAEYSGDEAKNNLKTEIIVGAPKTWIKYDSVERARKLLERARPQLPERLRWIVDIFIESGEYDSEFAPKEKPPRKAIIRTIDPQRLMRIAEEAQEEE